MATQTSERRPLGAKSQEIVANLLATCDGCRDNTVAAPCSRCKAVFDAVDWIERLDAGFDGAMNTSNERLGIIQRLSSENNRLKERLGIA